MKYLALSLTVIFVFSLLVTGYLFFTCDVTALNLGVTPRSAAEDPALFVKISEQMVYNGGEPLGDMSGYVFYTWRIGVANTTFAPVEMVQASIAPAAGDVCQVSRDEVTRIESRSTGEIEITVLARANAGARRTATVSWYLWGKKDSQTLTVE